MNKILFICAGNVARSQMAEERKITFWKINDPFGSSLANFRLIRDQIKALVKSITV